MVVLDVSIVNVALDALKRSLHFSEGGLQWVITSYAIVFGGFLLLGGRIADLYGRRRLFTIGVGVFTAGSALCALAWSSGSLIAFRGLERFRGDARLSTWLYRICVNVALGRIRTRRRRPAAFGVADLDQASADPSLGERPETPERSLERRRDQERVYRALEQLAPKKRIVLYLHEIEGLDLKEIAYLVESNPVTVRTRLFYARREFYKVLAGDGDGAPATAAPADGGEP